ncbi:MAG: pilus assembly PilX N-terminal domain-containing protein [Methylococcaceae bacterium]|nr:pilus assembly PilX N-terminal domain-containing protein [Methylococcaceae bacterium]
MNKQKGFSIIMAIFILIVLSLLGSYMVKLSGVQHATAVSAVQSSRAYYAARTGVEWGLAQLLNNDNCAASSTLTINNFSVIVSCNNQGVSYNEGDLNSNGLADDDFYIYKINSAASYGNFISADYVYRHIEMTVKK